MFITSQTAAYNSATRSHLPQFRHKESSERSKHRGHDEYEKMNSLESGKERSVTKTARNDIGNKNDLLLKSQVLTRKQCLSQSHLDAIISPRKAMVSSPLLLRPKSLQTLQLPKDNEKSRKIQFKRPVSLSREQKESFSKEEIVGSFFVERDNVRPASLHLPAQFGKRQIQQRPIQIMLNKHYLLKVEQTYLQKSSSLPVLSPTSEKKFRLPLSGNDIDCNSNTIEGSKNDSSYSHEVFAVDARDPEAYGGSEESEESVRIVHVEEASLLQVVDKSYTRQNIGQEASKSFYSGVCDDKIIPLHSAVIYNKKLPQFVSHKICKEEENNNSSPRNGMSEEGSALKRSPTDFYAYGNGLKEGIAYKPAIVYIIAGSDNTWTEMEVNILGPRIIPPKFMLEYVEEKVCRLTYLPQSVGSYSISIRNKGDHISRSPYKVNIDFDKVSVWQKA